MGEDPNAIREDIEATREHMSDTVDTLTAKASGTGWAKQRAAATKDQLASRATAAKDDLVGKAHTYTSDPGQAAEQAKIQVVRVTTAASTHPRTLISIAGTAAVLVAGFVAMATRARLRRSGRSRPLARTRPPTRIQRPTVAAMPRVRVAGRRGREAGSSRPRLLRPALRHRRLQLPPRSKGKRV